MEYIFLISKKKKEQEYKKQKLAAYGIDDNLVLYIHSYLLNRKQCVCINNILSEFNKVISGVPQNSIVGPILFNCFFNDFYYFIKNANVHNFADDNTLTTFAQNVGTFAYFYRR